MALEEPLLKQQPQRCQRSPFLKATAVISRLTFSWLNPLLDLGFQRPLKLPDIPKLGEEDSVGAAYAAFQQTLDRQASSGGKRSVASALASCQWKAVLTTGVLALLRTLTISSGPVFLYVFVELQQAASEKQQRVRSYSILLILGLTVVKVVQSLAHRHWGFESRRCGAQVRSVVVACIYDKLLKLSSKGRQRHSAGEMVSYIGVDAYRLGEFCWWMHYAWASLLQMLLALLIIFYTVNYAALACVAVLIVTVLIQIPLASALQRAQNSLMTAQDERLRRTAEVLNNIKIIKLQAWEEEFKQLVYSRREEELRWLKAGHLNRSYVATLFWLCYASAVSLTLVAYVLLGNQLNAAVIFTVFSAFGNTLEPIRFVPDVIAAVSQVLVSLRRLDTFVNDDEFPEDAVIRGISGDAVRIRDAAFSWTGKASERTLQGIDMTIRKGEKVAVCGAVGSGKSSLLCAVLGEIPKLQGTVEVDGSMAYVAQAAWIQSGTIRENILFGKAMDSARYSATLRACALDTDLEMFPLRDETEIGERGLNLSGGQKQRIQLARAVYNDADVYLLDDPFSAVDAHTAATLFHECVMNALARKTVILVTHQVEFLPTLDCVVVMDAGRIEQLGAYDELMTTGVALDKLVNAHRETLATAYESHEVLAKQETTPTTIQRTLSRKQQEQTPEQTVAVVTAQLTEEEEKEIGDVGLQPYKDYLLVSRGCRLFVIDLLLQVGLVAGQVIGALWLAIQVTKPRMDSAYVAYGYTVIAYATSVFLITRVRVHHALGLAASRAFFTGFMESLFRAPMAFFDTTPTGRILSRAANDMSLLDLDVVHVGNLLVAFVFDFPGVMVVLGLVMWEALILVIPTLYIVYRIERYFRASAQELMRLSAITKAPILNFSGETISGAATIRAFGVTDRFRRRNMDLVDTDASLYFHTNGVMEWLVFRVETCSTFLLCVFGLCLAVAPGLKSGLAGVGLAYALNINVSLVILSQWYCQMASHIVSVRRIEEYMHIPVEPPLVVESSRPPREWPAAGDVTLEDLQVRYRPSTPLVLKGVSCTFGGGEKVGVVGRTGSGKSTLISAMFRLVEPAGGRIVIDGIDICSIGLHDLRSKLGIIPQEATLFRGTVRTNLDPLGKYSDEEIWEALEKCQMGKDIRKMTSRLDSSVADEGGNWSAGQRQLFCLGRVLLKRTKILMLDEATASIDSSTDAVLQRVIRQEFASCTVVTVAHRIPTVIDSDMVLSLHDGRVAEYESPGKLLQDRESLFSKLVAEYWAQRRRTAEG